MLKKNEELTEANLLLSYNSVVRYWITFFLLFLLSFVVFPIGMTPFETPKVILFEISAFMLLVITISQSSFMQIIAKKAAYLPFVILFLLTIVQLFFRSSDTLFLGNAFRMQGIFLLWLLWLFSILTSWHGEIKVSRKIIFILLVLQLFFAVFITGQNETRAIGTMGEPNALAAAIVFLWPWVMFGKLNPGVIGKQSQKSKIKSQKYKVKIKNVSLPQIGGVIAALVIIVASGSRSGVIAFGMQLVFLFLLNILHISLKKTTIAVIILCLSSLLLPFLDTHTMYERRDDVWKASLMAGYEHPIIGWGFGNTEKALQKYDFKLYNTAHGYYVDSTHNVFLDWWVQGGVIGLAILLLLLYDAIKVFVQKHEVLYLVLLIGLVTAMSFNPVSIVTLVQFWWLIGQGVKT